MGEFTIFAGLDECVRFMQNFKFTKDDIEYVTSSVLPHSFFNDFNQRVGLCSYLRTTLPPYVEEEFYEYLQGLDTSKVTMHAIDEGSVVFPKVPLIRLEGPLLLVQLMETPFLTMVNFAR